MLKGDAVNAIAW